jgi:hypothetical protein
MSARRGKRYTTSYKEREHPRQNPYAMLRGVKGPAICRKCHAAYAKSAGASMMPNPGNWPLHRGHRSSCVPPVKKSGMTTRRGSSPSDGRLSRNHEAEIRGLIDNVEARTLSINPLARVMKIIARRRDLEVHTTTDRLAQRLGREPVRAFRGRVTYRWSHRDMLVRVAWTGLERAARKR